MKKMKKNISLVLLIISGIFLCVYGFTYAKYVSNSIWNYYLKSKGFYFSSDYLGPITINNVNNLWDGGSVHFNIKNNLNQMVTTNYDIGYRAVCTIEGEASAHAECHMNGTALNTQDSVLPSLQACVNNTTDEVNVSAFNETECISGGYDWVYQVASKDLYFDIVLTDINYELSDVVVNVSVTSTSPYRKTLSGDFKLHRSNIVEDSLTMNFKNYSNYDRLIVSNSYMSDKCVKVTWDSDKFFINADNSLFSSYEVDANGYVNEIKFNIEAKKSLSYIFYRKNFEEYNFTSFSIVEASGC